MTIPGGSALLTPALGQPIGVEFDDTAYENSVALNTSSASNPILQNSDATNTHGSWGGVDNVILQIAGVAAGDLNGDGVVDILDYRNLRDHLQSNSSYLVNGDMNGDGKVDLNDFRAYQDRRPAARRRRRQLRQRKCARAVVHLPRLVRRGWDRIRGLP